MGHAARNELSVTLSPPASVNRRSPDAAPEPRRITVQTQLAMRVKYGTRGWFDCDRIRMALGRGADRVRIGSHRVPRTSIQESVSLAEGQYDQMRSAQSDAIQPTAVRCASTLLGHMIAVLNECKTR
jgi:hypothetical protein